MIIIPIAIKTTMDDNDELPRNSANLKIRKGVYCKVMNEQELKEELRFLICSEINGDATDCDMRYCSACGFRLPNMTSLPDAIMGCIKAAGYRNNA
jgi:hypothetical protein